MLKRLLIINSPDCLDPAKDEEYNAIVDKYRVNEKQRRLFHQYIDYLKSNGELSGDTLSRAELDDLAREFFRKYK